MSCMYAVTRSSFGILAAAYRVDGSYSPQFAIRRAPILKDCDL